MLGRGLYSALYPTITYTFKILCIATFIIIVIACFCGLVRTYRSMYVLNLVLGTVPMQLRVLEFCGTFGSGDCPHSVTSA